MKKTQEKPSLHAFKHALAITWRYTWVICGLGLLAACTKPTDDLKAWVEQTKSKSVPKVPDVPPLKEYIVQPYNSSGLPSPFSAERIGGAALETPPDGARNREPLETVPLQSMKFIGSIKKVNQAAGLINIDGKIHTVKIGQHIGQSYGKITAIKDNGLVVRELIKDGANQWSEKIVTLPLQEGQK